MASPDDHSPAHPFLNEVSDLADDPWPSADELREIFPAWELIGEAQRARRSFTQPLRRRDDGTLAVLALNRRLRGAQWKGSRPESPGERLFPILEWGMAGDDAYLIYEDLQGPTLAEALDSGRVSRRQLLETISPEIDRALAEAHDLGLELDTRPEAILFRENGQVLLRPRSASGEGEASQGSRGDWLDERVAPGLRVGPYVLKERLGEGGFAEVYLAEQQEPMRRKVALKILKLGMDSEEVLARFEAERQALALLQHPYIASIYDAGATKQGRPYFVMERVDGKPLTDFAEAQQLGLHDKLLLMQKVCQAVKHAHEAGIVHRDLKPGNVLVGMDDEGRPIPKIIDFGIAKATQQPLTEHTLHTRFYHLLGSLSYMSPEQASMRREVDERADVYALGCLLYELLTDRTPLGRATTELAPIEALNLIRDDLPPAPSQAVAKGKRISRDLDAVVMKALEKDPEKRYASVAELLEDLGKVLGGEAVSVRSPGVRYRIRRLSQRRSIKAAMWVSFGALAASLILFVWPRKNAANFVAQSRLSDGSLKPVALVQFDGDFRDQSENHVRCKVVGDPNAQFASAEIGGESAQVLKFDGFGPHQWLSLANPIGPNGAWFANETNVYSIVMDVFLAELPDRGTIAPIYQAHGTNRGSAEVNWTTEGRLGKDDMKLSGQLAPGRWQRLALVFSGRHLNQSLAVYVDGVRQGPAAVVGGGDGMFAANEAFVFFSDKEGTSLKGMINSLAVYDVPLTDREVAALGAVEASGIPLLCRPEQMVEDESLAYAFSPPPRMVVRPEMGGGRRLQGYGLALDASNGRCLVMTEADTRYYGGAWIYRFDQEEGWGLEGALESTKGEKDNSGFAGHGDLWGNWAAIGSKKEFEGMLGAVTLYHRNASSGAWAVHQYLLPPHKGREGARHFGDWVAFQEGKLYVAEHDRLSGVHPVVIHAFELEGEKWTWREQLSLARWQVSPGRGALLPEEGVPMLKDHHWPSAFPYVRAESWLAEGRSATARSGEVILYEKRRDGSWEARQRLRPQNEDCRFFGAQMAMTDSVLAIWSRDVSGRQGTLDVFERPDDADAFVFAHRIIYPWPGDVDPGQTTIEIGGGHLVVASPDEGGLVLFYQLSELPEWESAELRPVDSVSLSSESQSETAARSEIALPWEGEVDAALAVGRHFYLFGQGRFVLVDPQSLHVVDQGHVGRDGWENLYQGGASSATPRPQSDYGIFLKEGWRQILVPAPRAVRSEYQSNLASKGVTFAEVEASFQHPSGRLYYLSGSRYEGRNRLLGLVDDRGEIGDLLPGAWQEGIDAAACPLGEDRVFLFKERAFQCFDASENRVIREGPLVFVEEEGAVK